MKLTMTIAKADSGGNDRSVGGMVVKAKDSGDLYEVQYVVHSSTITGGDVYCCYRLSKTDGMPIGGRVWIPVDQFIEPDIERLNYRLAGTLPRKR